MDLSKLRAWWAAKQGLDGSLASESSSSILARTGWARSVGGANPYLTLFARSNATREQIDADVANLRIHELPSARGCTYVLPAEDFALGLRLSYPFNEKGDIGTATKFLGVTEDELHRLTEAILGALTGKTLDTTEIKQAVGDAVRSLGDEGKKRGVTTTLPLGLGRLQSLGQIRRVPIEGRLDQQRYRYTTWSPSPCAGQSMGEEEAHMELARKYFAWIGPASLAHFQWFSGLSGKAAREATSDLGLVSIEPGSDLLLLPSERAAFESFAVPHEPCFALVNGIDALFLHRRNVATLLSEEHACHPLLANLGKDLEYNAIVDRGGIIGLWEYDSEAAELVWATFDAPPSALQPVIERTETIIRDQLGDARTFSLDSPQSRRPKLEALRSFCASTAARR